MSYCRYQQYVSDVYMYPHIDGYIECCACQMNMRGGFAIDSPKFYSAGDALRHLFQHVQCGHHVPHYAITRLAKEVVQEERYFIDQLKGGE